MVSNKGRRRSDELRQVPEIIDVCSIEGQSVVAIIGHREVGRRQRRWVVPHHITERIGRIPTATSVLGVDLPLDFASGTDGVGLGDVRPVCGSAERHEGVVRKRTSSAIPTEDVTQQAAGIGPFRAESGARSNN
jgi:hypothetical protein